MKAVYWGGIVIIGNKKMTIAMYLLNILEGQIYIVERRANL